MVSLPILSGDKELLGQENIFVRICNWLCLRPCPVLFGVVLCLLRTAIGPSEGDLLPLYGQLAYPKWGTRSYWDKELLGQGCVDMNLVLPLTLSSVVWCGALPTKNCYRA